MESLERVERPDGTEDSAPPSDPDAEFSFDGSETVARHHDRMASWCQFYAVLGRLTLAAAIVGIGVAGILQDEFRSRSKDWSLAFACVQVALGHLVGWFCDGKASVASETHRKRAKSWRKGTLETSRRSLEDPFDRASWRQTVLRKRNKDAGRCAHDPALQRVTDKALKENARKRGQGTGDVLTFSDHARLLLRLCVG